MDKAGLYVFVQGQVKIRASRFVTHLHDWASRKKKLNIELVLTKLSQNEGFDPSGFRSHEAEVCFLS